jgi:hypothetical protein
LNYNQREDYISEPNIIVRGVLFELEVGEGKLRGDK